MFEKATLPEAREAVAVKTIEAPKVIVLGVEPISAVSAVVVPVKAPTETTAPAVCELE